MKKIMAPPQKILLIQLGDVGDVVLTSPTIRAAKETYPAARVSIIVRKPFGGILAADPNLDEVIEFEKKRGSLASVAGYYLSFVGRLRRAGYSLVVDLRTGDRGAIFAFLTGAPVRVGTFLGYRRWHNWLYTKTVHDPPIGPATNHPGADQSLRIVRSIGMDTTDSFPQLHVSPECRNAAIGLLAECGLRAEGHWVTINPFSRWRYKEWDNDKWGEVIDWLWNRYGLPSVLVGSPEESVAAGKIVAGREAYAFTLTGKTTLAELAAVIAMSSLHLGVDSAAPHMATALDTPSITIHGPSNWRFWRIINDRQRVVSPAMACVPCNRMGCDNSARSACLEQLESTAMLDIIDEILHETGIAHER